MLDSSINIRGLKRTAVDEADFAAIPKPRRAKATGKKVSVIGGGPSGLTAAYKKFVTMGLISECNELGLDKIIQEIKASIYQ